MHATPAQISRPGRDPQRGTNLGFFTYFGALLFCLTVAGSVVGVDTRRPARGSLEAPGVAWVDGRALEGEVPVTRMHYVATDARTAFLAPAHQRECRFIHGEPVRLISEHDNQLHAANARCSAWVPAGWLSPSARPALGLLK